MAPSVVGVMKMENIVPRAGTKPTSMIFWASVLPLHQLGFPDYPHTYLSLWLFASEISADWNCKSVNAYNYIQAMALHIHTHGRFIN